ncbi:efflux RND transporter periplasmic adaptor subunit [Ottowia beijingensis]|uniref:Efflux RND transporter periplasmic adaptor subunit n=1 Tax=Ottowia beijingensis TaxID=1207057 RepID=A0A853IQ78_9BURK|nr:efflux RND transporter periplasmic adaptor subunit [Ottowia beijingensis]
MAARPVGFGGAAHRGAAAAAWRLQAPQVDVVTLGTAPLVRTLQFSARVATTSRVSVGATLTGRVADVAVREGDAVRQGDVLLRLETDEAQAALAQAQANAQQAQARLAGLRGAGRTQAQAQLAQADATLRAAARELARTQQLVASGFISEARLDDARRAVAVARAQRDGAGAQAQAVGERGAELAQAEAQLQQARAAVQAAQARLAQTVVHAPTDGRVLLRKVEPGQIVQPGSALLSLALAGPTELVAQVDERFLDQLQPGQAASVVADAFPAQPFAAQLRSLAPAVDAQRGSVEVKLAPRQAPPDFLREDMTLSVEVRTGERPAALALPLTALRSPAPGAAPGAPDSVWVLGDGRVQARPVRLGLRTLEAAEVLDGLAEGTAVIVGSAPAPGQRARPRAIDWHPGTAHDFGTRSDAGATLTNAKGR